MQRRRPSSEIRSRSTGSKLSRVELDEKYEAGSSLIEVLVAMLILLGVMVSVLQLFVMAVAVDRFAEAQSELTVKARSVVEIIRLVSATGAAGTSGILPLGAGDRSLPATPSDTGFDFWGPAGFNVIDGKSRYEIAYSMADDGEDWLITVTAVPRANASTGSTYMQSSGKEGVRYAARVPK